MITDKILIGCQILAYCGYLVTIFLTILLLPQNQLGAISVGSVFIFLTVILKITRCMRLKLCKCLLVAIFNFYIPILLTGVQAAFAYFEGGAISEDLIIYILGTFNLLMRTISYGFIIKLQVFSQLECIIYSFGIVSKLITEVIGTVQIVIYFDTVNDNDLAKDFALLQLSTGIAVSALMLDILLRTNERYIQQKTHLRRQQVQIQMINV